MGEDIPCPCLISSNIQDDTMGIQIVEALPGQQDHSLDNKMTGQVLEQAWQETNHDQITVFVTVQRFSTPEQEPVEYASASVYVCTWMLFWSRASETECAFHGGREGGREADVDLPLRDLPQ